jgi:phytoene/squalene synthetase
MPKVLTPSRYLAWLYSTDAQKPLLAALLELESEIASGLRGDIDHHVAHARVQWWGEEVERSAEGRPVHPLTRELVRVRANVGGHAGRVASVADAALAASVASATNATPAASAAIGATSPAASPALAGIAGFVDTAVWDLASATFETRKELTAYCERWAAAMFETAAAAPMPNSARLAANLTSNKALGAVEATAATAAAAAAATADTDATNTPPSPWKTLGAAVHEIELLADLARDARMGRLRVPLDELDRAGVDTNALAKLPWPIPLATLLRERHEALRATIAKCLSAIGREEQMALRGLLVWVALTWRLSVRAQNALPSVILPRRYDALAEGWQAWRAARRATAGHLRLS